MSKHTPGSWKANKPTQSNGRAEVHSGPMLVAQAFNWMLDAEGDEQCWADARLIAAAPDLLEALKIGYAETMDYIQRNKLGGENNHWLVLARAAIAKAEGA